jgi:hypothetical protein
MRARSSSTLSTGPRFVVTRPSTTVDLVALDDVEALGGLHELAGEGFRRCSPSERDGMIRGEQRDGLDNRQSSRFTRHFNL